jgi:hypothetical protein
MPSGNEGSITGEFECPRLHVIVPVVTPLDGAQLWRFADVAQPGSGTWQQCPTMPVWGPRLTQQAKMFAVAGRNNVWVAVMPDGISTLTLSGQTLSGRYRENTMPHQLLRQVFAMELPAGVGTEAQRQARFGVAYTTAMVANGLRGIRLIDGNGETLGDVPTNSSPIVPTIIQMGMEVSSITTEATDPTVAIAALFDRNNIVRGTWGGTGTLVQRLDNPERFVTIQSAPVTQGAINVAMLLNTPGDRIYYHRDVPGFGVSCSGCTNYLSVVPHPAAYGEYIVACNRPDGPTLYHLRAAGSCVELKHWPRDTTIGDMSLYRE